MAQIYVASSWRNPRQSDVVAFLRSEGHEVYDFRNPAPGNTGFAWSAVDTKWKDWTPKGFRKGLDHQIAQEGFGHDFRAMEWADQCVLVLPCGRSAHLEAGWFMGKGKPVTILAMEAVEPELMYLLAGDPAAIVTTKDEMLVRVCALEKSTCFGDTKQDRRFPMIDVEAVRKHMPPGFPPMDPNEMPSDVALAGVPLEPWGSAHFAASNRAL